MDDKKQNATQPKSPITLPFTIYIDSAEQEPFTFTGLKADADQDFRPYQVETLRKCLGRHPNSLGDYSISTGLGRCHVERKSMADAHGTILGWGERRERFVSELQNLAEIEAGLVVVECSFGELLSRAPETPKTPASKNAKSIFRSVISFLQEQRVPWLLCDSRRLAEIATFRWFMRWHEEQEAKRKREIREARKKARQIVQSL